MIFKEQFLELKHLKPLGVPTTTIAKKIGISVPNANKWLRMDEDAFENYPINNTPYLEQYRAFILNILKICPQTQATNIMYRVKDQFPDFNCRKTTFFRYIHDLREQTGYVKPEQRPALRFALRYRPGARRESFDDVGSSPENRKSETATKIPLILVEKY